MQNAIKHLHEEKDEDKNEKKRKEKNTRKRKEKNEEEKREDNEDTSILISSGSSSILKRWCKEKGIMNWIQNSIQEKSCLKSA